MVQRSSFSISDYALKKIMRKKPKNMSKSEFYETLMLEALDCREREEILQGKKDNNGLLESLPPDRIHQIYYQGQNGLIV